MTFATLNKPNIYFSLPYFSDPMASIGILKIWHLQLFTIKRGREKNIWIHTPTHLFPTLSRDWLPRFSCYLVFLFPNPRDHCGNEEKLQVCVSCTTVPSISMYNQELTGGRGKRRGDRKRERGKAGGRERKMLKYLRYKIKPWGNIVNTFPLWREFNCKVTSEMLRGGVPLGQLFIPSWPESKQQPETYLAESCNQCSANPMECLLIFGWMISLKITLLWSTSCFLNIANTKTKFSKGLQNVLKIVFMLTPPIT